MTARQVDSTAAANIVRTRRLGIDTRYEAVILMHRECHVCRSEGLAAASLSDLVRMALIAGILSPAASATGGT